MASISAENDSTVVSVVPRKALGAPLATPNSPSRSNASTSSARSESSTIRNAQAPFGVFKHQVKDLCFAIALVTPETPILHSRPDTASRSSASKFIKSFFDAKARSHQPTAAAPLSEVQIERLPGGTYNRIIGVTVRRLTGHGKAQAVNKNLILRIPRRAWEGQLERDVAILRYISETTQIPVPLVQMYDLTGNNALKAPYVLQTRADGYTLQKVYPNLSHKQNLTIVEEICNVIRRLQTATESTPGLLELDNHAESSEKYRIHPFEIKSPFDTEWKAKSQDYAKWSHKQLESLYGTTRDFFVTQFGRWRAFELSNDPQGILHWDYQHRFVEVAEQMNRLGVFKDQEFCLCHLDFYARNIMVDLKPDDSIALTAVLDWDSAVFAPKFVSCAPPWWLWQDDPDDDGSDWDELDESKAQEEPKTENGRELLKIFEESVGDDFLEYAYEPQYMLARKLFRFAKDGLHSNQDAEAADAFLKEWKVFYENLMAEAEAGMIATSSPTKAQHDDKDVELPDN